MSHTKRPKRAGRADDAVSRLVALIGSEASLQERLAALGARVDEQQAYLDRCSAEAADVREEMEQLQARLVQLRVEVALAERRVEDLAQQASDREQLVRERCQLESEVKLAREQALLAAQKVSDAHQEMTAAEERKATLRNELIQLKAQRHEAEQERAALSSALEDLRRELAALRSLEPVQIEDMDTPIFLLKEREMLGTRQPKLDTGAFRYFAREQGMDHVELMKRMIRSYIPREAYLASIDQQVADLEKRVREVRPARVKGNPSEHLPPR